MYIIQVGVSVLWWTYHNLKFKKENLNVNIYPYCNKIKYYIIYTKNTQEHLVGYKYECTLYT